MLKIMAGAARGSAILITVMRNLFFIFLLIFCSTRAHAQFKSPFFKVISTENGLPEDDIQTPLQDKLGYMWFNTQNGLVRYDGYRLKPYPMRANDGKLIVTCIVSCLFEDRQGMLWASVNHEGLYFLDRQKDVFIKAVIDARGVMKIKDLTINNWLQDKEKEIYFLFSVNANDGKPHVSVFNNNKHTIEDYCTDAKGKNFVPFYYSANLEQDAAGKIWITADSLLSCFDEATASFKPVFVKPDTIKNTYFFELTPDHFDPNIIWLMTGLLEAYPSAGTRKLIRFNSKTKAYKIYDPVKNEAGSIDDNCMHFFTDSLKRFWVSTEKGISLYNRQKETFTNYPLTDLPRRVNNGKTHIESLASDPEGNLWMSGIFQGIFYFSTKTGQSTYYTHSEIPGSFPINTHGTDKVFFDRTGTLWANMPYSGIARLDTKKSLFNPLSISPSIKDMEGKLSKIPFDVQGAVGDSTFLVKDTSNIFLWNYINNSFQKVDLKVATIQKRLTYTLTGSDGLAWIGSESGLFCYDPKSKAVKSYTYNSKDSTSISADFINVLIEDKNGNIWVGTNDGGICCLNKQSGKFKRYLFIQNNGNVQANNELDDANVYSMYFDSGGILWTGTNNGGLNRLDPKTNQFTSFLNYKEGFNCVTAIYEDSRKQLWVGTYLSGLFLVDKTTGSFKRYTEDDGLLYNSINGISEDKAGNIWIVSPRGLSMLESKNSRFTNYPNSVGLFSFHSKKMFRDVDYHFHIAVKNGLISFDPGKMHDNAIVPEVVIESISYHAAANTHNVKDSVVYMNDRDNLELKYNENRLTIQYIAIHYADADSNQYAYMLEGYDKEWINSGTQRSVIYTNLSPGTYTFHVKAANSNYVWNETGVKTTITILPPWWRTWLAYIVYVLLLVGCVWAVAHYRSMALRKENILLENKVQSRTNELQESLVNLKAAQSQLIHSEKMASLGELTAGIAHEIQNPLNFVNNFSDLSGELMDEMNAELDEGDIEEAKAIAADIKQNLEKINHHGNRAGAIVRGMLEHSRGSGGVKERKDINTVAEECLKLAYHGMRAKDKSFNANLKTNFDSNIETIDIISQDIGKVILNLLNNAFYAVNEKKKISDIGYQPTVTVRTTMIPPSGGGGAVIKIEDNGTGIPPNIIDKIFQPFFTTKPTGQGTGLGLSLSYDIITKGHNGELKVRSKANEFTEFTIVLPIS